MKLSKGVTFSGTMEEYNLCNLQIGATYISGRFQILNLPAPVTQQILGNIQGIRSPTPAEIEE